MVGLFLRLAFPLSMTTGSECHGTSFRSAGKLPRMKRSIKYVQSSMSTGKFGANPNHIWVFESRRRCS